jgi:F-type H+-transporting ATPase subunit b
LLIDPFTVGAQIVNFLILIWILRRVLYGPITRAMDAREARIREELDNARRLQSEAAADGERHRQLIADFEASRTERAAEARAELDAWRREHTQAVRQEVEGMRQRWQQALDQEKDAFLVELRRRAGREVLEVTRRVLRELADSDLDARVTSRFLIQLRQLSPDSRTRLAAAAREDGGQVHVRTAYPLAEREQEHLRAEIADVLGAGLAPDFETETDLVSGVELRAGGLKVAWALGDYLDSLEDALGETLAIEKGPASDDR